MKKTTFYTELSFLVGLLLLATGTALMAYGGFGISMVAAPAYILHLKLSQWIPFFTFGTTGYLVEALLLLVMMIIIRRVRVLYLLSFATAVLYGLFLDGISLLTGFLPENILLLQVLLYAAGIILCSAGISLMLLAYFPPGAHEMFVKEVSAYWKISFSKLKTLYDCSALALSIFLSLVFFGTLQGIGIGTAVCAFVNGFLIRSFTALFKKHFLFRDAFAIRHIFEERE